MRIVHNRKLRFSRAMLKPFSRRFFLGGALSGLALPALAEAPKVSLRPVARPTAGVPRQAAKRSTTGAKSLIDAAGLGGKVSYSVVDVKSGLVLEGHEARAGQPPASVAKAMTALYALDALGAGYTFETRLLATGGVSGGVVHGDLVLVGGGDPTLDTNALARLAAGLKKAGVREVQGKLRVWGGALPFERVIDNSQPEHVGYNPAISGINLNYNRVHFEWKRSGNSYKLFMDARSDKYRPAVRVSRIALANRKVPVYTYRDKGDHDSWTVASGALGNGGSRWLPVRKPEAYAAEVFAALVRSHGVALKIGSPSRKKPGGQVVARHHSVPLRDILRGMLKYSNNLTAELVGMTASAKRTGKALGIRASAQEMNRWARSSLGMQDAKLVDHSGLGAASRLTAQALAQALAKTAATGQLKPILKPIAMRREDGKADKGHPIKVVAKTGTLYFVSSLAGYMTAPDGTQMAFAILAANPKLRQGINGAGGERPKGSRGWNRRAKKLQQKLIERWGQVYGS